MRVQAKKKTRTAWLWTFIAQDEADKEIISYVFSSSRSGETPVKVLGDTKGKLVVDGYTGYNRSRCRATGSASAASRTSGVASSKPSPLLPARSARWISSSTSTASSAPRSIRRSWAPMLTSRCVANGAGER